MAKRISFCTTILLHDSNDNVVSCGSPVSDCRVESKMDDLVTVAEAGSIIYFIVVAVNDLDFWKVEQRRVTC